MPKIKSKMFAAVVLSVIALVLLAVASVAWFTISTNPEVSGMTVTLASLDGVLVSEDGTDWDDTLDLSEGFKYYAPLKPVSTVDGLNWFLPEYYNDGSLKEATDFELDDGLIYANSFIFKKIGDKWEKMTGSELQDASNQGYYVYSDFYIKTQADLSDVHITFPNPYSQENTKLNETDGSYVLPKYKLVEKTVTNPTTGVETKTGQYEIKNLSQNAQNTVRVGLLVNPDYTDYTNVSEDQRVFADEDSPYDTNDFYIYEPNADMRTATSKPLTSESSTTERYIVNYDYTGDKDDEGKVTPDDYKDEYYYETLPIMKTNIPEVTEGGVVKKYKYAQTRIDPTKLIAQKSCSWNLESLETSIRAAWTSGSSKWWSSYDVKYPYGQFLNGNSLYNGTEYKETVYPGLVTKHTGTAQEGTGAGLQLNYPYQTTEMQPVLNDDGEKTYDDDNKLIEEEVTVTKYHTPYDSVPGYASSQNLITLQKDEPVRIRLFIWIEGQDIDCWNDIAAGGFVVNLELGSQIHEDETPDAPNVSLKSATGFVDKDLNKWTQSDTYFTVTNPGEVTVDHFEFSYRKTDFDAAFGDTWSDWSQYGALSTKFTESGKYEVKFRAVSATGTYSENETTVSFCILKAPAPTVSVEGTVISGWYSGNTTINGALPVGTPYSDKLTLQYQIDKGGWQDGNTVAGEDGTHTYSFRTVANNYGFVYDSNSVTISVEKQPPVIKVSATSNDKTYVSGTTTNANVRFKLSSEGTHEELSYKYYYSINDSEKYELTGNEYTASSSGTYKFTVKSNVGAESAESEWIVVITAPSRAPKR